MNHSDYVKKRDELVHKINIGGYMENGGELAARHDLDTLFLELVGEDERIEYGSVMKNITNDKIGKVSKNELRNKLRSIIKGDS